MSLPLQKTYQDNKKEEQAGRLQKAPCSLLRHWPIRDKLLGLGVGSEVNFIESLNENIHDSAGRGWDHTTAKQHKQRQSSPPQRSSMSKCNFGDNDNNILFVLHPIPFDFMH